MPLNFPPRHSENDLNALALCLPATITLKAQSLAVFVTLSSTDAKPLVTIEIVPFQKKDFSGTVLSEFIEDLARTLKLAYEELGASDDDIQNRILQLLGEPIHQPMVRHLPGQEFRVRVRTIHTTKLEDWYP